MTNDLLRARRMGMISPSTGRPMTRGELAEAVNRHVWATEQQETSLDAATVARYERGLIRWPNATYRAALCAVLGAERDRDLGFYPTRRGRSADRLGSKLEQFEEGPPLSSDRPSLPAIDTNQAIPPFAQLEASHAAAMESFRLADRRVGGGHMYGAVVAYLNSSLARDLLAVADTEGASPFTVAAALSEMAGWMAHDAGNDPLADQHFTRAIRLAAVDGDAQVTAHVMGSAAHLALLQSDPDRATVYAARGLETARDTSIPGLLRARLFGMKARAAAARGDRQCALEAMRVAETEVSQTGSKPLSKWVSKFDEGSLAMEAARALLTVGDVRGASEQANRVVALRSTDRPRSRALGQLMLARSVLRSGQPDHAAVLAQEVLANTAHLGSGVVATELEDLGRSMAKVEHGDVAQRVALQIQREMTWRLGSTARLTRG